MLIRIYTWTERINYIHLRIFFKERKIKEKDSIYSIECVCVCARMHIYVCVYECACICTRKRKKETEPKEIYLANFFLCTNFFLSNTGRLKVSYTPLEEFNTTGNVSVSFTTHFSSLTRTSLWYIPVRWLRWLKNTRVLHSRPNEKGSQNRTVSPTFSGPPG